MKRAAILCPGPSLLNYDLEQLVAYDKTYAVNTAIKIYHADILSAGDITMVRGVIGSHRPTQTLITMGSVADQIKDDPAWSGIELCAWSSVPLIAKHKELGRPINWSVQVALCHAAHIGMQSIDLIGCDMRGDADATGYGGEDRTEDRWKRERSDIEFTKSLLHGMGAAVHRVHIHKAHDE